MPRRADAVILPNELLAMARERLPSPNRAGQRLSRSEMADAVNTALDRAYPDRNNAANYVDARWVGKLERGEHRWPSAERRTALRLLFNVDTDIALGLYSPRLTDAPSDETPSTRDDGPPKAAPLDSLRQTFTDLLGAGSSSGVPLDAWEQGVITRGVETRFRPAPDLLSDLTQDFRLLTGALHRRPGTKASRRLTRTAAHTAGLIFLTLIKMNQQSAAMRWALAAKIAADEADDPDVLCWVRAQEAYVFFYSGDLEQARDHAAAAQ